MVRLVCFPSGPSSQMSRVTDDVWCLRHSLSKPFTSSYRNDFPSGSHEMKRAGVPSTWVAAPPATGTEYTCVMRPEGNMALSAGAWMAAENSTDFPSGVNDSGSSFAELKVRRLGVPPFASTTYTSKLPLRSLAYAIFVPSGLHTGTFS